jgi:hypothetical protein
MDKLTRIAFSHLFEVVGERFTPNYIEISDKTGWMYSHQWTTAARDEYTVWLANLLKKDGFDPKQAEMDAMFFVIKNGWQVNDRLVKRNS